MSVTSPLSYLIQASILLPLAASRSRRKLAPFRLFSSRLVSSRLGSARPIVVAATRARRRQIVAFARTKCARLHLFARRPLEGAQLFPPSRPLIGCCQGKLHSLGSDRSGQIIHILMGSEELRFRSRFGFSRSLSCSGGLALGNGHGHRQRHRCGRGRGHGHLRARAELGGGRPATARRGAQRRR